MFKSRDTVYKCNIIAFNHAIHSSCRSDFSNSRAKHDVRHHIALMQEYLNTGELDALRDYLSKYSGNLPDDSLVRYCENIAANAVLC